MNGVIWSKTQQTFVPISSIPIYAKLQQERFEQSRAIETHNFQLQNLTLTSFEEPRFLYFHANNTKVSGLYGEVWNLLSNLLNFTLQPVRADVDTLGAAENLTHSRGLLGILFRNETVAIPKVEIYYQRLAACKFTTPFWFNSYYLYIRTDGTYDSKWMFKIFSWKIWMVILMMHVLITVCSFLTQNVIIRTQGIERKSERKTFMEHYFYTFRHLCNQSIIPEDYDARSRILELTSSLFSSVLFMAYGALLFTYLTKRVFIPPFDSMDALVAETDYKIVAKEGSVGHIILKGSPYPALVTLRKENRWTVTSRTDELYKLACSTRKQKYALYQGEDHYEAYTMCYLKPIGKSRFTTWMGSGIAKNFKYKRTLDMGVLKLMEVGLLNALTNRWLERRITLNLESNAPSPIEIHQVYIIILTTYFGLIQAFVIFIIENIVFIYRIKHS